MSVEYFLFFYLKFYKFNLESIIDRAVVFFIPWWHKYSQFQEAMLCNRMFLSTDLPLGGKQWRAIKG